MPRKKLRSRLAALAAGSPFGKSSASGSRPRLTRRRMFETLESRVVLDSTMVFNEVMYNPPESGDASLEWIELYNQLAVDVDISEWAIEGGVDYEFPVDTVIGGRDYLVVAIDPAALQTETGYPAALGPFVGNLSNGGEELRLVNNDGRLMNVLDYGDDGDWPVGADGGGVSLAKWDPSTASELVENWTISDVFGGTPGAVNFFAGGLPENLVLVVDPNDGSAQLLNQSTTGVALTGYVIQSDSGALLATWDDLEGQGIPGWDVVTETSNALAELNPASSSVLGVGEMLDLGFLWDQSTQDLSLQFSRFGGGTATDGSVFYGDPAEIANGLIARYPIALSEVTPASAEDFWLEIVNRGTQTVDLSGVELVATGAGGGQYTFPSQTIAPGDYLHVTDLQLGFHPLQGEKLFLYAPGGNALLDARVVTNRLRGRSDELGGDWLFPNVATPSAANSFQLHDEIVINEILYHPMPKFGTPATPITYDTTTLVNIDGDTLWRYNPTGDSLPTGWSQSAHAVDGTDWFEGPALIGYDTNPGAVAGTLRTVLDAPRFTDPYIITYYFETDFEFNGDPNAIDSLQIQHVIDDGAVFYLNGVELDELRFGMAPGPVTAATTATATVGDASYTGPISIPTESLLVGTNRLSVEVHQSNSGSSDIVFGAELVARQQIGESMPGEPFQESSEEWIELYNRGTVPVDISGWSIADAVDFEFPAGTVLAPDAYLVVAGDATSLRDKYPAIEIVGDFSRSLSDREDRILLVDADKNPADEVHYYESGRWSLYADGGGSSLELRDPHADNSQAEAWAASDESDKSSWQTYEYTAVSSEPLSLSANLQQFILGLLDEGEFLLDNVSVRRDPGGANVEVITNGSFDNDAIGSTPSGWRLVGNHAGGTVQWDGPNKVLHFVADGPQQHIHDHVTVDFGNGQSIQDGQEYKISLQAKWIAGSPQLNNRFYFTRMSNTFILDVPENNGTPGAQNSTYEVNVGPTYSDLVQHPVLPDAGEAVTISVRADDPDGIDQIQLRWAVDEGGFTTSPMTLDVDGLFYTATIPGQSSGDVVQFYVLGTDTTGTPGGQSMFPAAGEDSRALYYVGAGSATSKPIDTVRIIMLDSDLSDLTVRYNEMSNMYFGATMVHTMDSDNGPVDVAYHDVEVRQIGSRFIRPNSGYKIRLRPDQKFYGVHESIRLDMSLPGEIYMKHMVARAGGSSVSSYDDVAMMVDPRHGNTTVLLQLARYEDTFLNEQFVDGNDGTKWELDDIVIPTSPTPLGYNNDQAIAQDIRYRGPDPEFYRGHLLIKNQRYKDDYQQIVNMAWAINRTNSLELYEATNAVMDVDLWMRHYATQSFLGNWDTYGFGRPKNLRVYVRPEDGKIIPLFWDADRGDLNQPLIYNGGSSRLDEIRDIPQNLRLFWGHMWDLTNRSFNGDYMATWMPYYSSLGVGMHSANQLANRASTARSQAQSAIPQVAFQITTNGGNNFTTSDSSVSLSGNGWIDVREIRLAGNPVPYEVTWTDDNSWQITVPVGPGANAISLEAIDPQGLLVGTDSITVTSSTVAPLASAANFRITELNFNPQDANLVSGLDELDVDNDEFEFVELQNISPIETIQLGSVQFVEVPNGPDDEGITFTFGQQTLGPGERVLVVRNQAAFESRYGTGLPIAGQYDGKLANGGEIITLRDAAGQTIQQFAYDDSGHWPGRADGKGASLEALASSEDYSLPASWRSSNEFGGSPGSEGTGPVFDVIVNELLSHSDGVSLDKVELYNTTANPIDLEGWHLSDTHTNYTLFTFGPDTTLDAGAYLVLDESQLGFALDGPQGDDIWLVEGDPSQGGKLIRFADHHDFDATETDVTLGRVPNADPLAQGASLFPMTSQTFGAANSSFVVGEAIISEVMYDPAPVPPVLLEYLDDDELEYVEIYNNQGTELDLSGWQLELTDGGDFLLPTGTTVPAGGAMVLVGFDPVSELVKAASFRSAYGIGAGTQLVGPYGGKLNNDGEAVELLRPEAPSDPTTGFLLVDRVTYDNAAPWPSGVNGSGDAIHRTAPADFGNFAASWTAESPSPGMFTPPLPGDYDRNGTVEQADYVLWKTDFGSTSQLRSDGNHDGIVDAADFTVWRDHLGQGIALASVAEPLGDRLANVVVTPGPRQPVDHTPRIGSMARDRVWGAYGQLEGEEALPATDARWQGPRLDFSSSLAARRYTALARDRVQREQSSLEERDRLNQENPREIGPFMV